MNDVLVFEITKKDDLYELEWISKLIGYTNGHQQGKMEAEGRRKPLLPGLLKNPLYSVPNLVKVTIL